MKIIKKRFFLIIAEDLDNCIKHGSECFEYVKNNSTNLDVFQQTL